MSIYTGGTFSGLGIAFSGLQASQAAFEVAQHNIDNANTAGYSRQEITLQANPPYTVPSGGGNAPDLPGQFGTGVSVTEVTRATDAWLNERQNTTQGSHGSATQSASLLNQAQNLFTDPGSVSDTSAFNPQNYGLGKAISNYYDAWQQVGNFPGNTAQATVLLQRASELSTQFRQAFDGVEAIRNNADTLVTDRIQKANQLLQQIANLNREIAKVVPSGNHPNDLLDARDKAVSDLSTIMDVSTQTEANGSMLVYQHGQLLVQDETVVSSLSTAPEAPPNNNHLKVELTGPAGTQDAQINSGELAGITQTRDGPLADFETQLNTLANQVVTQTNAIHNASFTARGGPGGNFFNPIAGPNPADQMTVAITDPTRVAASATAGGAPGDGSQAFAQANVQTASLAGLQNQSPTQYYSALVSNVGTAVQNAQLDQQRFSDSLTQIQGQQQQLSGVNLDEEFINIQKFQRAYEAASRAVSNYDDMLNQVINHTGRVGL